MEEIPPPTFVHATSVDNVDNVGPSVPIGETPSGQVIVRPWRFPRQPRWLGDDGRNVFIEIQGQLACVAVRKGPSDNPATERGKCKPFSRASRHRLFKIINRLQFDRAGKSSFFTATFPDEAGRPELSKITYARSWFQKDFERKIGHHACGLWRVEWKKRLSGRYVGQLMPHVHTLYFGVPWVEWEWWYEHWRTAIGYRGYVNIDIKAVRDLRGCLNYVGKYIAKMPDEDPSCTLGIDAYLNQGRAWGTYRRNLLPVADKCEVRTWPSDLIKRIRAIATEAWAGCPQFEGQGFSVFGPAAEKIQLVLDEWLLTDGENRS